MVFIQLPNQIRGAAYKSCTGTCPTKLVSTDEAEWVVFGILKAQNICIQSTLPCTRAGFTLARCQ